MRLSNQIQYFLSIILQNKKLFFIGLIIKFVLGSLLASDFVVEYFVPFLNSAFNTSYTGAYQHFNEMGKPETFPYPSVMLFILSIFKLPFHFFLGDKVGIAELISIRLALLVADAVILFVLLTWLRKKTKLVYIYYWLSPILIYINYIHGQLDVIPICLLFVSLYFCFKNKPIHAAVFLALAVGCKTSVVLTVPFIFFYLYKNAHVSTRKWFVAILAFIGVTVAYTLPFVNDAAYFKMVYQNQQQLKIFSSFLQISEHNFLLIVPVIYIMLWLHFCSFWQMSRSLLLMYLGFVFGIFTVFVAANQGWYYWSIPFFIYFLISEQRNTFIPFILINVSYFAYFALVPNSDYISVTQILNPSNKGYKIFNNVNANFLNLSASILQAAIIGFCYFIFRNGISQYRQYKMLYRPHLIGISGNSSSGKTTLANLLQMMFGNKTSLIVNGDDMHKWERNDPMYKAYTHLHPKANHLYTQLQHFLSLGKGLSIERRSYNHATGSFTSTKKIDSAKIVIFEGLHTLFFQQQKNLFDLTVFLKPTEDLRLQWKIERDKAERGHSEAKILQSIRERRSDEQLYINTQEQLADVVIQFGNDNKLMITCSNIFNIEEIIVQLDHFNLETAHEFANEKQIITTNISITKQQVETIGAKFEDLFEEIGLGNPNWEEGMNGLLQLFLCQIIFDKLQIEAALKTN